MHRTLKFFAVLALLASALPASSADVGVSVTVGHPGFYGHIDIGGFPQPRLLFPEPLIITPVGVVRGPVYLHVPPGHAKDWRKHCHKYNACGERVYFVQNAWYNDVYVPRYQEHHGKANKGRSDNGNSKGKDKGNDNRNKGNHKD
jgi:hypothetical protein